MVIPCGWFIPPLFRATGSDGSWPVTARLRDARWLVFGHQVPREGMDQLALVALFCPLWAVYCAPCSLFSLAQIPAISYYAFLVPHQSGKIHIGPSTLEPIRSFEALIE
jgi:hypothetical protein